MLASFCKRTTYAYETNLIGQLPQRLMFKEGRKIRHEVFKLISCRCHLTLRINFLSNYQIIDLK